MFLPSFDSYFSVVTKFGYFIGLIPLRPDLNRRWFNYFIILNAILIHANYFAMQYFFFIHMTVEAETAVEIVSHIPMVLFCCEGLQRFAFMMYYREKINILLDDCRELYATPWKYNKKLVNELDKARRNFVGVQYSYAFCNFMFCGGPILVSLYLYFVVQSKDLLYIAHTWRPFDKYKYAWLVFILDTNMARYAQYGNTVPDGFMIMMMIQLNYHFECLGHAIQDVVANLSGGSPKKGELKVVRTLKDAVIFHNKLIDMSERINNMFTTLIFCKFMTASMTICCTGFVAIASDDYLMISQFCGFLLAMLIQPLMLSIHGDLHSEKTQRVAWLAYDSNWYNCNLSDIKMIQLIMLRAQRPCFISMLDFAKVTRATFKEIMATAYSFLNLMRKLF